MCANGGMPTTSRQRTENPRPVQRPGRGEEANGQSVDDKAMYGTLAACATARTAGIDKKVNPSESPP